MLGFGEAIEGGEGNEDSKIKGPREFDSHEWADGAEEGDVLDATGDLVKRAMIKNSFTHSTMPESIKDLLETIEKRKNELNYKRIILSAIKRSASGHDRRSTWNRPNKRYGTKAPGTKIGLLPKLEIFLDSSGSISIEELSEFLNIVDEFLKCGARICNINMFHTSNYYSSKYKVGQRYMLTKSVESGGTDLEESISKIIKVRPDLSIIITDGYYSDVNFEKMLKPTQKPSQVLFIISKGGQIDHPLKRLGSSILIPS